MEQSRVHTRFALGTFSRAGWPPFPGIVLDEKVISLNAIGNLVQKSQVRLEGMDSVLSLLEKWDTNFTALQKAADLLRSDEVDMKRKQEAMTAMDQLKVYPPVNLPRQILCCGANYRKHVIDLVVDEGAPDTTGMDAEAKRAFATKLMDERAAHGIPYFFSKVPSAVTGPYDPIVLPRNAKKPDWELELGVVMGRSARHVARAKAFDYVAGYTIVNDLTNRDLVFREDLKAIGTDWLASKSLPSYLPTGPYLVPAAFVSNPQDLQITLKLNGQVMQNESTADMIFDVARQIEHLSDYVQLWPGDVIATGSPAGNGTHYNRFLRPGDVIESSITGLGTQRNTCIAEKD